MKNLNPFSQMKDLIKILKIDEGYRGHPYDCGTGERIKATKGHVTIGYGRNLDANPYTEEEAERDLIQEVERLMQWYAGQHKAYVTQAEKVRFQVIIAMSYQLGVEALSSFEKMWAALIAENYDEAAEEMLDSKWAKIDSPARAERMAWMMRHGKYHPFYEIEE